MSAHDVDAIREVVARHGQTAVPAAQLKDDDDLYRAGLTSHASINLMLALEDTFDVEFPDYLLKKSTFQSIAAIRDALDSIAVESAVS